MSAILIVDLIGQGTDMKPSEFQKKHNLTDDEMSRIKIIMKTFNAQEIIVSDKPFRTDDDEIFRKRIDTL